MNKEEIKAFNELVKVNGDMIDKKLKNAKFDKSRVGVISGINANGTYEVKIDGIVYSQVQSINSIGYKLNQTVKIIIPMNQINLSYIVGATDIDIYPIGSIYMSVNNVNPSNYFGNQWVSVANNITPTVYMWKRTE